MISNFIIAMWNYYWCSTKKYMSEFGFTKLSLSLSDVRVWFNWIIVVLVYCFGRWWSFCPLYPMIAKLVVWSDDRLSALRSIRSALSQYHVSVNHQSISVLDNVYTEWLLINLYLTNQVSTAVTWTEKILDHIHVLKFLYLSVWF